MMRYVSLLFAGFLLCASAVAQQQQLRRAPGFALPDSKQQVHDLYDYRGRWVLLDFMKTDCPHCKALSPVLEQAKARYGAKLAVLSVVVPPDTTATAQKYAAANKLTSPFLFDCGQATFSYIRPSIANPAVEFPHLYVINPEGFIVRDLSGAGVQPQKLLADLDSVINAKRK